MTSLIRREPVVNRQLALTAMRLEIQAPSSRAAVQEMLAFADVWPSRRNAILVLPAAIFDATLLDWQTPANAILAVPAALIETPAGLELARQLEARGTALCLTDFPPQIDLPATPRFRFAFADSRQSPPRRGLPVLATGLADHAAFADAIDQGFGGAAGWFFLHGLPVLPNKLNPGHAQIIHILNLVRQNADLAEIEHELKQDICISFKLLRYINSAGMGLATTINSFRHAVTMIGYQKLNKWLSLLLVTASRDPAASALMQTAIMRGRFMELVAADRVAKNEVDNLFITGSFSLLDVLLGSRIDTVLGELNLPAAISSALLARSGPYAPYLELALACEQADTAALAAGAAQLGLSAATVNRAQMEALAFADNLQMD